MEKLANVAPKIAVKAESADGTIITLHYSPEEILALTQALISALHELQIDPYVRRLYKQRITHLIAADNGSVKVSTLV